MITHSRNLILIVLFLIGAFVNPSNAIQNSFPTESMFQVEFDPRGMNVTINYNVHINVTITSTFDETKTAKVEAVVRLYESKNESMDSSTYLFHEDLWVKSHSLPAYGEINFSIDYEFLQSGYYQFDVSATLPEIDGSAQGWGTYSGWNVTDPSATIASNNTSSSNDSPLNLPTHGFNLMVSLVIIFIATGYRKKRV